MRSMVYKCDGCSHEETGFGLPHGWMELRFYNKKDYWYHFCSYACLTNWSEARDIHYSKKEEVTNCEIP